MFGFFFLCSIGIMNFHISLQIIEHKQVSDLQMENQGLKSRLNGATLLREELSVQVESLKKQVAEAEQRRLNGQ
jgi:hypothetical protein